MIEGYAKTMEEALKVVEKFEELGCQCEIKGKSAVKRPYYVIKGKELNK